MPALTMQARTVGAGVLNESEEGTRRRGTGSRCRSCRSSPPSVRCPSFRSEPRVSLHLSPASLRAVLTAGIARLTPSVGRWFLLAAGKEPKQPGANSRREERDKNAESPQDATPAKSPAARGREGHREAVRGAAGWVRRAFIIE